MLESPRTVAEAISAGFEPLTVAVPERAVNSSVFQGVLCRLTEATEVLVIVDSAFDSLAPSVTPQPMLAVIERPQEPLPAVFEHDDLVIVLVGVSDPGNAGTIVRSAHACAARCVVFVGGADPWSPKAVRASSGSALRVPIVRHDDARAVLKVLREAGARVVASDAASGSPYLAGALDASRGPLAVVAGSEARGLDRSLDDLVHDWVHIGMAGGTESLNVAMATTLLAFEFRRPTAPKPEKL